jgi:acid phosphatase
MMKIIFKTIMTLGSILLFFSSAFSEPSNLGLLKTEVINYHDSGAYEKELTDVISKAHHYIVAQVDINKHSAVKKNLAIVLDIDETSLSNYDRMVKRNFTANRNQFHQDILAADAPAIKPMLFLYNDAIKQGVKVFFVTGRQDSELDATKTNLLKAGYKNWTGLYLRPNNYQQKSIIHFKQHTRALISKKGYTIIASIGDQYSDLLGGHAKREFKLPNPYYFLP